MDVHPHSHPKKGLREAGTTTASAIFLLCCILQFFVKFGGVILSVTALSILPRA